MRITYPYSPLLFLAIVTVPCVRDFIEMKRSLLKAHRYILTDLKADPCRVDGGFEFKGYHCYQKDFVRRKGLSWWWVTREDYLVTLGPLRGYRVVKTFPFHRYIGANGAVYILQREGKEDGNEIKKLPLEINPSGSFYQEMRIKSVRSP